MKILLLLFLSLLTLTSSFSQDRGGPSTELPMNCDTYHHIPYSNSGYGEVNMAGYEMKKASNTFYTGIVLMVVGSIIGVVGYTTPSNKTFEIGNYSINQRNGLMTTGAVIGGAGFIISISSIKHIGRAGRHLENY